MLSIAMDRLPTICLAMIVKNEQDNLQRSLGGARRWFDHTLVIDTGSTDGTVGVAQSFGAQVQYFDWINDFSAARNEWAKYVRVDWIFWLDADDELPEETGSKLLGLAAMAPADVFGFMFEYVYPNGYRCDHIRLYRNHPAVCWKRRIHESLWLDPSANGRLVHSRLPVLHPGYPEGDLAALTAKGDRNLTILMEELEADPKDPLTNQYIAVDRQARGKHEEACGYFEKAIRYGDAKSQYTWLPEAYINYARSLVKMGKRGKARKLLEKGRAAFPEVWKLFVDRQLIVRRSDGETAIDYGRRRFQQLRALS